MLTELIKEACTYYTMFVYNLQSKHTDSTTLAYTLYKKHANSTIFIQTILSTEMTYQNQSINLYLLKLSDNLLGFLYQLKFKFDIAQNM